MPRKDALVGIVVMKIYKCVLKDQSM